MRRWCIGLIVGGAVTSLPWLVSRVDVDWARRVDYVIIPGALIAMLSAGGNVHTYSETVLFASNIALYAIGTYCVLKFRQN